MTGPYWTKNTTKICSKQEVFTWVCVAFIHLIIQSNLANGNMKKSENLVYLFSFCVHT